MKKKLPLNQYVESWSRGTRGKILYSLLIAAFAGLAFVFLLKAFDTGSYWYYLFVILYVINICRLSYGLVKLYGKK